MKYNQKRTIFGITLTKRAWNNILIYAVLLLMFLLYYASPRDNGSTPEQTNTEAMGLIPGHLDLQQIIIDDQTLEHSNNDWRCRQPCSLSKQQSENVARTWLSLRMQPTELEPAAKVVDVYLYFGGDQTATVEIYTEPRLLLRLPQQQRVFEPMDVTIESLLGR